MILTRIFRSASPSCPWRVLAGAGAPLLLRQLGIDPAVSSAVFVITFTDVFEFLIFLAAGGFLVRGRGKSFIRIR